MTRLGDLLKFLVTNSLSKVAQILGDFLGYFEKYYFFIKHCSGYFCGKILGKFGYILI